MTKEMNRGKQQILFNYLPGKTFDFERGPIARVTGIRGFQQTELSDSIIVQKISSLAREWSPAFRPALGDHILSDVSKFVLLDPVEVDAEMFPKVLWCQNLSCGRVIDVSGREDYLPIQCPTCKTGRLTQLRWVRIHRCGALESLTPPSCPKCHGIDIGLSTRESERISAFRWVCRNCNHDYALFGGYCQSCDWPDPDKRRMDIEVHRAGRTYYPQTAVLLNIPTSDLKKLLSKPNWHCIVASNFLSRNLENRRPVLASYADTTDEPSNAIPTADLDKILESGVSAEEALRRIRQMRNARLSEAPGSADAICEEVTSSTGVGAEVWKNAAPELLEAVMPFESGEPLKMLADSGSEAERQLANRLGVGEIALAADYTIVNATFGFTRGEFHPDQCWLRPFSHDRSQRGKLPIYVDRVQADAILISLDPSRVLRWMNLNGAAPAVPAGLDRAKSESAYFVKLFDGVSLLHTIGRDRAELRMVFGLLHSLSHACVRQASLLCGLERTSLSEYVLPRSLSFALYCNHRFGSTIGALTALYQQALPRWLTAIRDDRSCVYDPVCHDHEGSCHACMHLAETSCRFFNLNLSRSFLFGGPDEILGNIPHGYFQFPATP